MVEEEAEEVQQEVQQEGALSPHDRMRPCPAHHLRLKEHARTALSACVCALPSQCKTANCCAGALKSSSPPECKDKQGSKWCGKRTKKQCKKQKIAKKCELTCGLCTD